MPKINITPFILLSVFYLVIDNYVLKGVLVLAAATGTNSNAADWVWWLCSFGLLLFFLIVFARALKERKMKAAFKIVLNLFLVLLFSKLVFLVFLASEDVYRTINYLLNGVFHARWLFPARSIYFSGLGLVAAVASCVAFLFGVTAGKYHYKVHETTLFFDDLPDAFDGFKIAQISDIHAGSFDNVQEVQKGVNLINEQKPDLFLFTGDLVNNKADEIEPYLDIFKQIKAPYGCFSVLGNHDYGDYITWRNADDKLKNLELLKSYHRQLGYKLLLDEHQLIEKDGQYIAVVGVENWGQGFGERGDLTKALNGLKPESFKILLSHDPSHWDAQVKLNVIKIHLTLSGHTHGMQFGFEIGKFKWSPVKYRYPNWAGLVEENGKHLYVNRGFGFLGFSGRVGIWPEITIITLKRKRGLKDIRC